MLPMAHFPVDPGCFNRKRKSASQYSDALSRKNEGVNSILLIIIPILKIYIALAVLMKQHI